MFSREEKKHIAAALEKILLDLNHPEMAKEKVRFKLHVEGQRAWSWAHIEPNWTYEDKEPGVNEFYEVSRKLHEDVTKQIESQKKEIEDGHSIN